MLSLARLTSQHVRRKSAIRDEQSLRHPRVLQDLNANALQIHVIDSTQTAKPGLIRGDVIRWTLHGTQQLPPTETMRDRGSSKTMRWAKPRSTRARVRPERKFGWAQENYIRTLRLQFGNVWSLSSRQGKWTGRIVSMFEPRRLARRC